MNESADQTETESAPGNVMDQIEDFIAELISGEKPGLLAGVVIGILVCAAIFIGLLYHCVRRSGPPKDIPLICHGSHGYTRVNIFWPV